MIPITALPLIEYFDTFESNFVVRIAFVLVILPLVLFVAMKVFTSKQSLEKMTNNIMNHFSIQAHKVIAAVGNSVNKPQSNDVDLVIDDSMKRNATMSDIRNYVTK